MTTDTITVETALDDLLDYVFTYVFIFVHEKNVLLHLSNATLKRDTIQPYVFRSLGEEGDNAFRFDLADIDRYYINTYPSGSLQITLYI